MFSLKRHFVTEHENVLSVRYVYPEDIKSSYFRKVTVQTWNMTPYSRKNNNQTTANRTRQNKNPDKIALLTILEEFAFCLAEHLRTTILAHTI